MASGTSSGRTQCWSGSFTVAATMRRWRIAPVGANAHLQRIGTQGVVRSIPLSGLSKKKAGSRYLHLTAKPYVSSHEFQSLAAYAAVRRQLFAHRMWLWCVLLACHLAL
jgi:hypothetical protein